jgi:tRNA(Arg) A34 adenosine deaminase TadA
MCCWAIVSAGIGKLVLGGRLTVVKKVNYGDYTVEKLLAMAGESVEVLAGIREEECTLLRSKWEEG